MKCPKCGEKDKQIKRIEQELSEAKKEISDWEEWAKMDTETFKARKAMLEKIKKITHSMGRRRMPRRMSRLQRNWRSEGTQRD